MTHPDRIHKRNSSSGAYRTAMAARQRGAVAVIVAAMLFVLLGVCGMAIDLGMMYNRRVELQNLAEAVALAAANKLDGTPDGITRALAVAEDVALRHRYRYGLAINWDNAAVQFATVPDKSADWLAANMARGAPGGRLFARVDTLALDASIGLVQSIFMNAVGQSKDATMRGFAIARRTGIRVAPLQSVQCRRTLLHRVRPVRVMNWWSSDFAGASATT